MTSPSIPTDKTLDGSAWGWNGLPLLRIEGAPTEEEARAQLRQLAENPQVNEMASRDDYHGMKFRAAIKAATN